MPILTYPTSNWHHRLGVTLLEFRWDVWHQKTRVPVLSYGVVCVILCLAVLVQCWRVTDRHTTKAYTALA